MSTLAIIGIILGSIAFLVAGFFFIGFLFYKITISRKALTGEIVDHVIRKKSSEYGIDRKWWDQQNPEKITASIKGDKLVGFLLKKPGNKVAIVVHGYYVTHRDTNYQANIFLKHGFSVFAPDLRAHGESDGKTIGMGYLDQDDINFWIRKVISIFGNSCEIVLCGTSMGASTVCLTAGKKLPKNVKCVIADCGFENAYTEFESMLKSRHLPHRCAMFMANSFAKLFGKYDLKKSSPIDSVKKTKLPILFIHGTKDEFVPTYMSVNMYNASNKQKCELYLVEDAGHGQSFIKNPEKYEEKIIHFVDKNLK